MSIQNASGLNNVLLCQRKSNQENEDEQKHIKPASDRLGLSGTRILFFHKLAIARGEDLFSSCGYQDVERFFMTYSFFGNFGQKFSPELRLTSCSVPRQTASMEAEIALMFVPPPPNHESK